MQESLSIRNICKKYDKFSLEDVSFCVPRGSIVGLIGENGAGKSTTLRIALGMAKADSGEALFAGKPLTDRAAMEDVGVVPDGAGFHEGLTPKRVGKVLGGIYKQWDAARYKALLDRFAVPEKAIKEMSKGMKAKLMLACALSHDPKLLILDEATSGLDPVAREDLLDELLDFVQDEGRAVLLSSHITTDLERVADHIVFLHKGRVILSAPKDELRYKWGVARCTSAQFDALDKSLVAAVRREDYQISALVRDRAAVQAAQPELTLDSATLEEIMLLTIKGEGV